MTRQFLTFAEAHAKVPLSERQFRRYVSEGRIPVYRVGRELRFKPKDVDKLVRELADTIQADESSVTEVAELLGVADKTVRRWIATGTLKARRLRTGALAIHKDEIARLQRERSVVHGPV